MNIGPEVKAEFVDFHAGPVDVSIETMFVYVTTFQFTYVSSSFVVALPQYFCHLITFSLFVKFVVTEISNVAT